MLPICSLKNPTINHQLKTPSTMSTKTQILHLFLLFLLITSSATSTTADKLPVTKHTNSATNFIWSSCRATRYPALCYHNLAAFANKINQSERQLALTALAVSLTKARSAAQYVIKLSQTKGLKHRDFGAVKDCVDTMGDTVDQLSRSFKELGHLGHRVENGDDFMFHMSNVQTWVSAALTDENTCMDGFSGHVMMGSKLKGAINMRLTNVAQVTSNALALVNRFASRH